MFIHLYVLPSRLWNLPQSFSDGYISATTHQKAFILGWWVPWRVCLHSINFGLRVSINFGLRVHALGWGWKSKRGIPYRSVKLLFLAHLSRRLTRWAYRMGLEPVSQFILPPGQLAPRGASQPRLACPPGGKLSRDILPPALVILTPGGQAVQGGKINCYTGVRPCVRPSVHPHFQTWISARPAGRLQPNFIWSIIGVGERLHGNG